MSGKLVSQKKIEETFNEGTSYLVHKRYEKAISVFQDVINYGTSPYLTGAYVNMARAIFEHKPLNKENATEALNYINKAIEIKPTNQAAKSLAIPICLFLKNYKDAIEYFLQLTSKQAIYQGLFFIETLESPAINREKEIIDAILTIEKMYDRYKFQSAKVGSIMINSYIAINELFKAYEVYKEILTIYENKEPRDYISLCVNFGLFCNVELKNGNEAVNIIKTGIKVFEKQTDLFKKENKELLEILFSNLAMVYLHLNEFQSAIDILVSKVKENPSNTDLHNLAHAYYRLGNYDEALIHCKSALFISTDETTLFIKAEILYFKKKFMDALIYYKKSISFLMENDTTFKYKENDGRNIFTFNHYPQEIKKKAYIGLIHCYTALNNYELAKVTAKLALSEWPFEDELIKVEHNIDSFLVLKLNESDIQKKVEDLKHELLLQKRKHKDEIIEIKEWGLNLIKLQNRCHDGGEVILDGESDWRVILRQMHEIAIKMRDEKMDQVKYDQIKNNYKHEFPSISSNGLEFISTGEYLFRTHRNQNIDFAPVMVEYSKVIEIELNRVLMKKGFVKKNQSLTLGQIKHNLQKFKFKNLPNIDTFLNELIIYRNGSAHIGRSTVEKVEKVRNMIIVDGWLKLILDQN